MTPVSVVVATYGRERELRETLAAMLGQSYPGFELIVVDQTEEHEPETARFLGAHADRLRVVRERRASLPHARNVGLSAARGEIVLFVDDDVIPDDEHLIEAHVARYGDPAVGAVAGRVREPVAPNAPPGVARVTLFGRTVTNFTGGRAGEVETAKGANMSFRRDVIRGLGGFDTRYGGTFVLEETDASYRLRAAGWKVVYEPRASLYHRMAGGGGCRTETWLKGRYWLYRNSAMFYRKLKPRLGLPFFLAFFAARGVLHVAQARGGPRDYLYLMSGIVEGLRAFRQPGER